MTTLLHEIVDKLIDNGKAGQLRRRLFNLDAAAVVELENLPPEKASVLYQMDPDAITNHVKKTEDCDWDSLATWQWDRSQWPQPDPDPACHCEEIKDNIDVNAEYPEPEPRVYAVTPLELKANTPTRVEIVGLGFVADVTSVELSSAGATKTAPLLGPLRGTFRCGRMDVLVDVPAGDWDLEVKVFAGTEHEYTIPPKHAAFQIKAS